MVFEEQRLNDRGSSRLESSGEFIGFFGRNRWECACTEIINGKKRIECNFKSDTTG